jgi:hypothetical protein
MEIIEIWPGCTTDLVFEPKPEDYLDPYDDGNPPSDTTPAGGEIPRELVGIWHSTTYPAFFEITEYGYFYLNMPDSEGWLENYAVSVEGKKVTVYSREKESGELREAGTFVYSIEPGNAGMQMEMNDPTGIFVSIASGGPFEKEEYNGGSGGEGGSDMGGNGKPDPVSPGT